ncbi:MAG: DNA polymerase III subunit [Candidatus Riflebacteria bacterium]|nr:DNA polymerase III subunit [Candidatus Riflebacteria bacterium]
MIKRLKLSSTLLQEYAIRRLSEPLANDRIAQSYLFTGAESVGKGHTANALAAALQCLEPVSGGPAGVLEACCGCLSCKRIASGTHPDVLFIAPMGAEIRIDQVRAMQDAAQLKPFMGKWRIFVIDQADRLNEFSGNSLLKILEESPPRVVFLLIACGDRRILPTILSRTVRIDFPTPSHEAARKELLRASGRTPDEVARFYAIAGGRFGVSLSWLMSVDEMPEMQALTLPQAQVSYLEELARLPGRLEERLINAGGIEPALRLFSDSALTRPIELLHARRELARGLIFAPALPRAFPLLFTRLLLEAIDGIKRDLKKTTEVMIKKEKGNYPSGLLRDVEEGFGYAIGEVASEQLQGFLRGISDWAADLFHAGLTRDENLLLNKEAKNVIMSVVDYRGPVFAQTRIAAITSGLEQIRRYINPSLVFENILSDLGGCEP